MIEKLVVMLNKLDENRNTKGNQLHHVASDSHAHYFASLSKFEINEHVKVVIDNGSKWSVFTRLEGIEEWLDTDKVLNSTILKLHEILEPQNILNGLSVDDLEYLYELEDVSAKNNDFKLAHLISNLVRIQKMVSSGGVPIAKQILSHVLNKQGFYTVVANFDLAHYSDIEVKTFLHLENANIFGKKMKARFLSEIPNGKLNEEDTFEVCSPTSYYYFQSVSDDGENYVKVEIQFNNFDAELGGQIK